MADRDETLHGLLIKTTGGNAKRNPLVTIATDAAQDMPAYAGHFGLTSPAPGSPQAAPDHHRQGSSRA